MSDTSKAVFLSYASQDAEAAKKICEALRAAGVEVWFDQSELVGGDAWDHKIRSQIRDCVLLIPVISKATQARREAYFRLEWRLADERTYLMAKGTPFLLPVSIDETSDRDALVPDSFLAVQWTKLPGGETSPAFCSRVKRLLEGESREEDRKPSTSTRDEPASARAVTPRWLRPVLASATIVIVVLGVTLKSKRSQDSPRPMPPPTVAPKTETESEARQLATRAKAIIDQGDVTRDRLEMANDLCERALKLDSADAVVWTTAARMDLLAIYPYAFDRSEERRQRAESRAARAVSLDPKDVDTRLIQAQVFAHAGGSPALLAEAEKILRDLVRQKPGDKKILTALADAVRAAGRFAEAADLFEQAGDWESAGWSYRSTGNYPAAEIAVDRALAERRSVSALRLKAYIELVGHEDSEAAQKIVDNIKPSEMLDEATACDVMWTAFSHRDHERVLQIMNALPQEYLSSDSFTGPKRWFTGFAYLMAGRQDLARAEWRSALTKVEERLKAAPRDQQLLVLEAQLQAYLGERDQASKVLAAYQDVAGQTPTTIDWSSFGVFVWLDRHDEVFAWLGAIRRTVPKAWTLFHARLRFSAEMDPLRKDPRFEKLLRESLPEGARPLTNAADAVIGVSAR